MIRRLFVAAISCALAVSFVGCASSGATAASDDSSSSQDSLRQHDGSSKHSVRASVDGFSALLAGDFDIKRDSSEDVTLTLLDDSSQPKAIITIMSREFNGAGSIAADGDGRWLDAYAMAPIESILAEADGGVLELGEHVVSIGGIEFATFSGNIEDNGSVLRVSGAFGYANGRSLQIIASSNDGVDYAAVVAGEMFDF